MTSKKVDVKYFEPQSLEWLNARRENITGTEVSVLFGLNKYSNPTKLLQSKLESIAEVIDNVYLRAGRFLEPAVIADLKNYGIEAKPVHESMVAFVKHPKLPLSVSLDGKAILDGKFYVVECKTCSGVDRTTGISKFDSWKESIPVQYYLQVQTQLFCTGVNQAIVACAEAVMPFPILAWEVLSDSALHELISAEVVRFYECYKEKKRFFVNKEHQIYIEESLKKFSSLILV